MMEIEKRHVSLLIASVLCLPLLLFAVLLAVGFLLDLLFGDCPDVIAWSVLWGVWWVAESPLWVSLVLCGCSLALLFAWFQSEKTKRIVTLLSLYSIAIIGCIAYMTWWHASGCIFDL